MGFNKSLRDNKRVAKESTTLKKGKRRKLDNDSETSSEFDLDLELHAVLQDMSEQNRESVKSSFRVFKHFIDSTREEPYLEQPQAQAENLSLQNNQFSFDPMQYVSQLAGCSGKPEASGQPSMAEFLMKHGDFQNPSQEMARNHQILEAMSSMNNQNLDQNLAYLLQSQQQQSQPAALLLNQLMSGDPDAIALLKQNTGIEDAELLNQFIMQALVPQLLMNSTK